MRNHKIALYFLDLVLVLCASVAANELRNSYGFLLQNYQPLLPYLVFTAFAWAVASLVFKTNLTIWRFSSLSEYLQIVWACMGTAIAAAGLSVVYNRMDGVARSLPVLQFLVMMTVLVGTRVLMRLRHARRLRPQQLQTSDVVQPGKTVLLLGPGPLCDLYLRSVSEFGAQRVHVAGVLGRNDGQTGRFLRNVPVLGTPDNVLPVVRQLNVHGVFVDEIIVAAARDRLSASARDALDELEETTSIRVRYLADDLGLSAHVSTKTELQADAAVIQIPVAYAALSADEVEAIARRRYWRLKRWVDVAVATVLLVVFAPLMLVVATIIAVELGLPVTFWQRRPGLGSRPFRCLKFRTMGRAHDSDGHVVDERARISAVGRFLRALRIDELPQLLNILIGDMSLVGPRPLLPADQPLCARDRLMVRPGITGWAQVCGGRDISAADKSALDIWYIRNASWRLDLLILFKTLAVICGGERVDQVALAKARNPERQESQKNGLAEQSGAIDHVLKLKQRSAV